MNLKDWLDKGAYLFPITKNQKIPMKGISWKELSTDDPEQIEKWNHQMNGPNWAVDCEKSSFVVVDIDVREDRDGMIAIDELRSSGSILPETLVQSTPSGGYHYFYKGSISSSTSRIGKGVDIKSIGGYVLIAPSSIHDKHYTLKADHKIAAMPEWVAEKSVREVDNSPGTELLDLPASVAEATAYIQTAPVAVQGDSGDHTTFRVAAMLRDFGISPEVCLDLMVHYWNPKCSPPWDEKELRFKVSNAYKYSSSEQGSKATISGFEEYLDLPDEEEEEIGGPRHVGEFGEEPPEREWIIEGWLPANELTLFTGEGGLGKSLLALQLAASVASGVPFLGEGVVRKVPVLVISCEDSDDELHRRWSAIKKQDGFSFLDSGMLSEIPLYLWSRTGEDNTLAYVEGFHLKSGKFTAELRKQLAKMGPGTLLILDTVSDVFAGNENERTTVNKFVKGFLGKLIKDFGSTVLTIGHPPKNASQYSGSTAWSNAHRNRIFLSKPEGVSDDGRVLERSKSNYATSGAEINLRWDKGCYVQADMEEIHDDTENLNLKIVYDMIQMNYVEGRPVSTHGKSKYPINYLEILDSCGNIMSKETKIDLTQKLLMSGYVDYTETGGVKGLAPQKPFEG